jgi:parallel beta-helix repeat protein
MEIDSCKEITISNNTIYDSNNDGITLVSSNHTTIIHNSVNQTYYAIKLVGLTYFNVISNNSISNSNYGVALSSSINTTVIWNNFISNSLNAYDYGFNNTFHYNYWDDWTSPDSEPDGFVDSPYNISGSLNNNDSHPLVDPNPQTPIYKPIIIGVYPKELGSINIYGDSDFSTQGFPGSGTKEDPYRIEGYSISGSSYSLIEIRDTTVHFILKNNTINGMDQAYWGILLYNIGNGTIENNMITHTEENGVRMEYSNNNTIVNNTVNDIQGWAGIGIRYSSKIVIVNNTLFNNTNGISLYDVADGLVLNNSVHDMETHGIALQWSNECKVSDNTIFNNNHEGVAVWDDSSFIKIDNNLIYNNNLGGVHLNGIELSVKSNQVHSNIGPGIRVCHGGGTNMCYKNEITDNTVFNNTVLGIELGISSFTLVDNNTVFDNQGWAGIFGQFSDHNTISNNIVYRNNGNGIDLNNLNKYNISNNIAYNNLWAGISLGQNSSNNIVTNNRLFSNDWVGLSIYRSTDNNITHNFIFGNNAEGIYIERESKNNTIHTNLIYMNFFGIYVKGSHNNEIRGNLVFDQNRYGIWFTSSSSENTVKLNNFTRNKNSRDISQAYDDGTNNLITHNYWNDWVAPDTDVNGVVDKPYLIEGDSNNYDQHPLVSIPTDHILFPHEIISPTVGGLLSGLIIITWTEAVDTRGLDVAYDIYYSSNDGTTWAVLANDLTHQSFEWDTIAVSDGNYRIKVIATSTEGRSIDAISERFTIANHQLTTPSIQTPSGGDVVLGETLISWTMTSDTNGHSISYSVYFLASSETTWIEMASGLSTTSHTWDTTVVEDGLYLIKILATCSDGLEIDGKLNSPITIQNAGITSSKQDSADGSIIPLSKNYMVTLTLGAAIIATQRKKRLKQ